ncbi:cellulase family glycosylhydrolase [Bacillus gobiensis]|uniref:GH39 family glycosyl hydrolase n=1 Tax=Bacillus gobiensis TaxID=1441095 RepID=UPI003D2208A9
MNTGVLVKILSILLSLFCGTNHYLEGNKIIPWGLGVNVNSYPNKEEVKIIREAGLHYVRIDLTWATIEKEKGEYDFTPFDRTVNFLKREGITPFFLLAYSNPLYEEDRSVVTAEGRLAFVNYVSEALERYKGLNAFWEVWNEPNFVGFWSPQPSQEMYSYLLKSVAPVIKQKDPSGFVVAPALSKINNVPRQWLEELFKLDVLPYIDVLSVHPYPDPYPEGNPELILNNYELLKDLVKKYSKKPIPIISGEWGYPSDRITEITQAQYLTRMFLINSMLKIPVSIWFNWKDKTFDSFGLYRVDDTPKPSYKALSVLTESLNGFKFKEKLSSSKSDEFALLFINPTSKKKALVLWTTGAPRTMNVPFESGSGQFVTMLGETSNISWDDQLMVGVSQSPVYLLVD